MHPLRTTALAAVAFAIVSGCAAVPENGGQARSHRLTASVEVSRQLGPLQLGQLSTDGTALVAPAAADSHTSMDRVARIDLRHRPYVAVLARTGFRHGYIDEAVTAAGWVAWVDQVDNASDPDTGPTGPIPWRLLARPLAEGSIRTLAAGTMGPGTESGTHIPTLAAGGGRFAWTTGAPHQTPQLWTWKPGATPSSTPLRDGLDLQSVTVDRVVFLGHPAHGRPRPEGGGACWVVTTRETVATPITDSGLAMSCAAYGDDLVFEEHVDPHRRPLPPDGILGNPWTVRLGGPHGRLLHRGYIDDRALAVGHGFVVWGDRGLVGRSLPDGRAIRLPVSGDLFAAAGDRLFTARYGGRDLDRLTVTSVRID